MTQAKHARKFGFTLIELLIFISLITTVLVVTIGAVSYAISALTDARNRTLASHYSTELAEWMRFRRDLCFIGDLEDHAIEPVEYYCFNDANIITGTTCNPTEWPISQKVDSCSECPYLLRGNLQRCAALSQNSANNRVEINITTSWYTNAAKQSVTTYMFLSSQ